MTSTSLFFLLFTSFHCCVCICFSPFQPFSNPCPFHQDLNWTNLDSFSPYFSQSRFLSLAFEVERERRGGEKEKKNGRCAVALATPSELVSSGRLSLTRAHSRDSEDVYGASTKRQAPFWVLEIEQ